MHGVQDDPAGDTKLKEVVDDEDAQSIESMTVGSTDEIGAAARAAPSNPPGGAADSRTQLLSSSGGGGCDSRQKGIPLAATAVQAMCNSSTDDYQSETDATSVARKNILHPDGVDMIPRQLEGYYHGGYRFDGGLKMEQQNVGFRSDVGIKAEQQLAASQQHYQQAAHLQHQQHQQQQQQYQMANKSFNAGYPPQDCASPYPMGRSLAPPGEAWTGSPAMGCLSPEMGGTVVARLGDMRTHLGNAGGRYAMYPPAMQ